MLAIECGNAKTHVQGVCTVPSKKLWKTAIYPCAEIQRYMGSGSGCRIRNMIWLTEDRDRALSYGPEENLKSFTLTSDVDLWNLMSGVTYPFEETPMNSAFTDTELKGPMMMALNLFGGGSSRSKCIDLYNFLTGTNMTVGGQIVLLSNIHERLDKIGHETFKTIEFRHAKMTPDEIRFDEVIKRYMDLGTTLSHHKELMNQRLSIYGLDQILLKLICHQELSDTTTGVKGWYIPSGTTTVWTEIVGEQEVSDMGEIALFNVNFEGDAPLVCSDVSGGKKKSKRKSKKRKTRRTRKKRKRRRKR